MRKGQKRYENWTHSGFSGWLEARLTDRLWDLAELERASGIKVTIMSRWMTGRQLPNPDHVVTIARALSVSEEEALHAAGYLHTTELPTDPRMIELHRRLDAVPLTHERYLALNALLISMEHAADVQRRADTPVVVEAGRAEVPVPSRPPHEDGRRSPQAIETTERLKVYSLG